MNGLERLDLSGADFAALDPEIEVPALRVYDLEQFLRLPIPPREYLVDPWLLQKGLAMVHAWRGRGKTWFALSLGLAVATGSPFLKWQCPQARRVLYIDGEMPGSLLQERLASLLAGAPVTPAPEYFKILSADLHELGIGSLDEAPTQELIHRRADEADLIILDNLSTLVRGGVENEGESWLPVQDFLLQLRRDGKSVVMVHHQGKNGEQRGTSRREDILDTVIALEKPDGKSPAGARFKIVFEKSRGAFGPEVDPVVAVLEEGENGGVSWAYEKSEHDLKHVADLVRDGLSRTGIAEELGVSRSKAQRLVVRAKAEGLLDDE